MLFLRNSKSPRKNRSSHRDRLRLGMETFEERALMAFGAEFAIGSELTDNRDVATASADDGTSIAVWTVLDGNDTDIVGQLYNSNGSRRGGIINISTDGSKDSQPAVAMEDNGDFAVSFTREHNFGFLNLSVDKDIHVRRFNANGSSLGGTIGVTTSNSEIAFDSDIAMDSNGDFIVTYTAESTKTRTRTFFGVPFTESFTDQDVRARRFNSAGNSVGGTFGIDTSSLQFESTPSVAMADDGRFVVAYQDGGDVHMRRFSATGGLRGTSTIATSSRSERSPDVAVDSDGDAVVVWQDSSNASDIKARRVSDGGTRGSTFTVRGTSSSENTPSVALEDDGEFIVAYNRSISSGGLVATHVNSTRVLANNAIQGSEEHGQGMTSPSISVDGNDRYFVGYNDFIVHQTLGRFGQMGSAEPEDKMSHDFDITLVFTGFTAAQRNIFQQAADRWEQVIAGDVPQATFNGTVVDDIRIDAISQAIDGVGQVLGQAGPDSLRAGSLLPIHGNMTFDTADIANLESDGRLFNIILHEMGHVLGIGTLWDNLDLIEDEGTANVRYTGANGVAGYNAARGFMGMLSPVSSIPVESGGGAGTADSHWDEAIFDTELMTGFAEAAGTAMPLSRMTIGSLKDIGYTVSYADADPFTVSPLQVRVGIGIPFVQLGGPAGIRADGDAEDHAPAERKNLQRRNEINLFVRDRLFETIGDDVDDLAESMKSITNDLLDLVTA